MAKSVNPLDQPIVSADKKYYKSGQRSVINNSMADAPKKIRPVPTPRRVDPNVPLQRDLTMSSDVYYANDGKARSHGLPVVPPIGSPIQAAQTSEDVVVTILEDNQLRARMELVLDRVRIGYAPVRVALAHRELIKAARQFVEMAVAREEITEDQGRDIIFGLAPPRQQPPGVREAAVSVQPLAGTVPPEMAKEFDLGDPARFAAETGGITRDNIEEALRTLPESPVGSKYQGPAHELVHTEDVQTSAEEEDAIPVEDQDLEKPSLTPEVTEDEDDGDSIHDDSD